MEFMVTNKDTSNILDSFGGGARRGRDYMKSLSGENEFYGKIVKRFCFPMNSKHYIEMISKFITFPSYFLPFIN